MNNRVPASCVVDHEKCSVQTAPANGVIPESQPTRCGHTLARCPLPGLARGVAPSNPFQARPFVRTRRQAAWRISVMCRGSTLPHAPLAFLVCEQKSTPGKRPTP